MSPPASRIAQKGEIDSDHHGADQRDDHRVGSATAGAKVGEVFLVDEKVTVLVASAGPPRVMT